MEEMHDYTVLQLRADQYDALRTPIGLIGNDRQIGEWIRKEKGQKLPWQSVLAANKRSAIEQAVMHNLFAPVGPQSSAPEASL